MPGKGDTPEMIRKFGIAMMLGLVFTSYLLAGGIIGYYLDKWLGTTPWMFMIFFFAGMGGAIFNVMKLSARLE